MNKKKEMVDHPAHYNAHPSGIECIDVVEHMSFNVGNAIKYLWRADEKHDSNEEDMRKALWYMDREMQRLGIFPKEKDELLPSEAILLFVLRVLDPDQPQRQTVKAQMFKFFEDHNMRMPRDGWADKYD